ncbi:hypothetical protein HZS_3258 [Henneguya salminicola]|nr:hypothetical protein HZS_3258 [Henneguya salminicola]
MQRKTKAAYDTVGGSILRMINLNCFHAMCDFELASINSFNQRNPHCELTDCFFHFFAMCTGRKIREKGLSTLYVNDHLFRKNTKIFLSRAFCPPESVLHCFESFEKYSIEKDQMYQIKTISSADFTEISDNNPYLP